MTEAQLIAAISKLVVGDAARIPLADFVRAYDEHRSVQKHSPQFAALAADFGSAQAALVPAIQRARDDQFFGAVWTTLLERLGLDDDAGANSVTEALANAAVGTMQKVLRAEGFRRVASWPSLIRAAKVTALIKVNLPGGLTFGTGFLVGPDLLITAAHVIASLLDENGTPRGGSADQINVEFHNQLESGGEWPIRVHVAKDWLEAMSPPLGAPPHLGATNAADAGQRLDFALLRLAQPVGADIGYLDMRQPPPAEKSAPLTIIGYPGGSDCLSDDHLVIDLEAAAARVRHGVNAIGGMSGSPCLGADGSPVAMHEGAVDTPPPYNRAVALRSIRALIKQRVPDPLENLLGPLLAVDDPEARRLWASTGEARFADPRERAAWLASIEPFDPRTPSGGGSRDAFHPVFGRAQFIDWIDRAGAPDAQSRVAFIAGQPLTGKSFSLSILKARLRRSAQQLIAIGPEALRLPLPDVIARVIGETTTGARGSPAEGPVALRPAAGMARRDFVPGALNEMERLVVSRSSGAKLLWIVLDFGNDSNVTAELSLQWKEWLTQASSRAWLRTIVIGLRSTRQKEFAAALTPPSAFLDNLMPLNINEFQSSMEAVLRATAPLADVADVQGQIDEYWDVVDVLTPQAGRAIEAVRAVLTFRHAIQHA